MHKQVWLMVYKCKLGLKNKTTQTSHAGLEFNDCCLTRLWSLLRSVVAAEQDYPLFDLAGYGLFGDVIKFSSVIRRLMLF